MPKRPKKFAFGVLVALLVGSATVNVLQANRIRALLDTGGPSSTIGRRAGEIEGRSKEGLPELIDLRRARVPTVLYYFDTSCGWCERNWPNVDTLAKAAKDRGFRFIGLTMDQDTAEYLTARGLTFQVLEGLSAQSKSALGLLGTPHTLVVSSDGVITHEWRGAYSPRLHRQIEKVFQITLPGVSAAETQSR